MYNNIDWWIDWYVDDYVELSKQQQKAFDAALTELHDWHRETQLPEYVNQLISLKEQVNRGITEQELVEHQEAVRVHWKTLMTKAAPEIAKLSKMLTKEQIKDLKGNIEKDNQKKWREFEALSMKEWRKERQDEQIQDLKEWVGKLDDKQKAKINELSLGYQRTFIHWMEYREQWQGVFFDLIDNEQLSKNYVLALSDLMINGRDKYRTDEYLEISNANNKVAQSIMLYQLTNLSSKQKRKFNREIENLIEDLTDLITD
ncbi:hypothetical protein GCM10017161_21310 [Thalassotalea marina]|uniref:Uncharacterized protein n=1 Tax=Thalassotalea marina TaxID=1673741 RepID=A0A919EJX0_9GAMM|nr:hypothetical protein GCM10017161_21310 [Thalassotalea marina]